MRKQQGFSLIELLIVVAIILIIAAIAIPNLLRAKMAANESSAVGSIRAINTAEITYASAYPTVGFAPDLASLGSTASPCHPDRHPQFLLGGRRSDPLRCCREHGEQRRWLPSFSATEPIGSSSSKDSDSRRDAAPRPTALFPSSRTVYLLSSPRRGHQPSLTIRAARATGFDSRLRTRDSGLQSQTLT